MSSKPRSFRKPKVSVIIPNWNGQQFLQTCLLSLKKQTFKDFEVMVVDNGSVDGSVEYMHQFFPQFKVIELEKNVGFAKAVNIGIEKSQGKYIVLINNDTRVDKNCLYYLVKAADRHQKMGMVTAKMLQFNNPQLINGVGDYIDVVGHADNIGRGEKDGPKFSRSGSVFLVSGGGGLFKREVFDKVGLFDEDYFAYFEDVDLCLRAQFSGFKGWYEPKAVIYHIHKATAKKINHLVEYLQFRNMTMTVLKNFPAELLKKDLNWLKIILVNFNTVRYMATQGYLWQALGAQWYIFRNVFKILQKRAQIQSHIKVPMDYVIKNFRPKKVTLFGLLKRGF